MNPGASPTRASIQLNIMLNRRMDVVTLAQRPDLEPRLWDLTRAWPQFMLHDPIGDLYYANLQRWGEHTLLGIENGQVITRGFSIAFAMGDEDRAELPSSGWDRVVHWSYLDTLSGREPTEVSALEIAIAPEHRGRGLAAVMVRAMVDNVARMGYRQLFAPVRPSAKHLEPATPMEEYVRRVRPDGLPEDPWMRVHARLGAEVLSVCPRSMVIAGTLSDWRSWTGLPFDEPGTVEVPGALVPVHVDLVQDHAVYVEPNVWMVHRW